MNTPRVLAGRRRTIFARLCLVALAQGGIAAGIAFLVRRLYHELIVHGSARWSDSNIIMIGALCAGAIFAGWLRRREQIEAEMLGQRYANVLRLALYDKVSSLAPRDLQNSRTGGHLLRFVGDLSAIQRWISLGLARLCIASMVMGSALVALWFINPILALTVTLVFLCSGAAAVVTGRRLRNAIKKARRIRSGLISDVTDRISAMPVIQLFSQVARERKCIARRSRELRDTMIVKASAVGSLRGIAEAGSGLSFAAILAMGALEISQGRCGPGAVMAAFSVLGVITPRMRSLSRVHEYWHAYCVSIERISAFLEGNKAVPDRPLPLPLTTQVSEIEFREVALDGILKGVDVKVSRGSVIAVVGPNGTGKSTLLLLVARLLEPTGGEILIDGQPISGLDVDSVRATVGLASPDLPVLRGTVEENIRYRQPDASDDEVRRVCAISGVEGILSDLPHGMDTMIVEGGANLSLGQRHRIMLARALLGRPRILLLDEIESNLDATSTRLVDTIIKDYEGIVLFVSHRLDRIVRADIVWHINDGRIVECGEPAELLRSNGPTQRLLRASLEAAA